MEDLWKRNHLSGKAVCLWSRGNPNGRASKEGSYHLPVEAVCTRCRAYLKILASEEMKATDTGEDLASELEGDERAGSVGMLCECRPGCEVQSSRQPV